MAQRKGATIARRAAEEARDAAVRSLRAALERAGRAEEELARRDRATSMVADSLCKNLIARKKIGLIFKIL